MPSAQLSSDENSSLDKGYCYEENGWVFVHIEGAPYERGFQQGYLLAEEIQEVLRVNKYLVKWETGEDFGFFVEAADRIFTPQVVSCQHMAKLRCADRLPFQLLCVASLGLRKVI